MDLRRHLRGVLVIAVLTFQACAGVEAPNRMPPDLSQPKAAAFFSELDRMILLYDVRNASHSTVQGFPFLRTNRFFAALKNRMQDTGQERCWLNHLQQADLDSRKKELRNLPQSAVNELAARFGFDPSRNALWLQTEIFSNQLLHAYRQDPRFVETVKQRLHVPDEYSTLYRAAGLYPLAGIPVTIATALSYGRIKKWYATAPARLPVSGSLARFTPRPTRMDAAFDPRALFLPENLDPLGLPRISERQQEQLAIKFAPVIYQDVAAAYDRFGAVQWLNGNIDIDTNRPAVYFYVAHGLLNQAPALQLHYVVWYTERTGNQAPWFEKGPLDGFTFRVTLDHSGKAAMIDIMNNCGCYHFFVPRKSSLQAIKKKPGELEPLLPAWMPEAFPEKRIQLRVNSGWHQVQQIALDNFQPESGAYELLAYDELESLPRGGESFESAFTPHGIMKNSWRIEPYIFFSMGIPKVGFMRQRGHHATKLVNREHFSNPYLFDNQFAFQTGSLKESGRPSED